MPASPLSRRILLRLEQAKAKELDLHLQDDIHIAWLIVLYLLRGDAVECTPHVLASYRVLGMHPDKVWPWIVGWRKAKLGSSYSIWYDEHSNRRSESERASIVAALPPKKPVQMELSFHPRENAA